MSLSDKGVNFYGRKLPIHTGNDYFMDIEIKKSIKKLKESISKDLDNSDFSDDIKFAVGNMVTDYIDEEFGDALCTNSAVEDKDE